MSREQTTPVIEVSVQPEGSRETRIDVSDLVTELEYEDCEAKADLLKLTVDNSDLALFDDPIFRKGNLLTVSWGYAGAMSIPRVCQIRKVTGFQELSIEALGKEVELHVTTRVRSFENMKRSDVVRQIAREWGFRDPELLHIQDTQVTREHVAQARMTDAQFLRRLAKLEGFEWYIDHDGFHFHERDLAQRTVKLLEWRGGAGELLEVHVENDVTRRAGSVALRSHNPTARRTIDVDANILSEKQRAVLGAIVEAPGKTEAGTPGFKSIAHHTVGSTVEGDEAGAKRAASAAFKRAQQVAVKLTLTIAGDPNVQAKSIVELVGVGKRLSQRYYVRTATHSIKGGYSTTLECISDGSGGHSTKSTIATEASAVNVGPKVAGVKKVDTPRRTIDLDDPKALTPKPTGDGSTRYVPPR